MAAKQPRVPERTCIACRQATGKRSLIRIVRSADRRVMIDESGKAAGRGAYVHPTRVCWEKALNGGTMSNALKVTPSEAELAALTAFATTLPEEERPSI